MANEAKKETIVDSTSVPSVFVDGIHGMSMRDSVVVINMTSYVHPAPNSDLGEPFNQVVQRLTMPAAAFVRIADWFSDTKERMVKDGVIKIQTEANDENG